MTLNPHDKINTLERVINNQAKAINDLRVSLGMVIKLLVIKESLEWDQIEVYAAPELKEWYKEYSSVNSSLEVND